MGTSFPMVGVVVLNYNGEECLGRCLRSLRSLKYPNFFVVVVDNASKDGSFAAAAREFPEFTYVRNAENRGFAAGMNVGMRAVFGRGASWAWLFNNDATTEPSTLTRLMVAVHGDRRIGLASPFIIQTDTKKLWFGKGRIDMLRMRAVHESPSRTERRQTWFESGFLTGCALLVRKEVYDGVGPLDEDFFLYYEDADLSLRAKAKGFLAVVVSAARVFHIEQSEKNDQKLYYLVLSGLRFFQKHARSWSKPYFLAYGTMRRLKNIIMVILGDRSARVVRRAYNDYYGG